MSSAYQYYLNLATVQQSLFRIGGPIIIALGTVSCVMNLLICLNKKLRDNPCAIHLGAANAVNVVFIYISILPTTLSTGYSTDLTSHNDIFCRSSFYITTMAATLSATYVILALIDRIFISSPNAQTRQHSNRRVAYYCILGVTVFWLLCNVHIAIMSAIVEIFPMYFVCYFPSAFYRLFITYFSLVFNGIIIPLILIFLSLWIMINLRKSRRIAVGPFIQGPGTTTLIDANNPESKEHHLIRIVFINVFIIIFFNLMMTAVEMYQLIATLTGISSYDPQLAGFLLKVATFISYLPFPIAFYANLAVSSLFRNLVKSTFLCD